MAKDYLSHATILQLTQQLDGLIVYLYIVTSNSETRSELFISRLNVDDSAMSTCLMREQEDTLIRGYIVIS
jgi:hypothetical protein